MKNSSPLAPGQNPLPPPSKTNWWLYPLWPFYLLILLLLPGVDLIVFAAARLSETIVTLFAGDHNSQKKDFSYWVYSWAVTLALIVLVLLHGAELAHQAQTNKQLQQKLVAEKKLSFANEQILNPPKEINLATTSSKIKLNEQEINQLLRQENFTKPQLLAYTSQTQALNRALAHYYLGNWEKYLFWLEKAKNLDPNSPYLKQN